MVRKLNCRARVLLTRFKNLSLPARGLQKRKSEHDIRLQEDDDSDSREVTLRIRSNRAKRLNPTYVQKDIKKRTRK